MGRRAISGVYRLTLVLFCLCTSSILRAAQNPLAGPVEAPEPPQFTLHAYTNLIQIPVLVLSPSRERLPRPIPPERFFLRIDSGPWFRATHVRREGDDALTLSILLDTRGDSAALMPAADEAVPRLAPGLLHPIDHVTLYALGCELVRAGNDASANPIVLREQVAAVLQSWRAHTSSHAPCANPIHLLDAMLHILGRMSQLPGRRVLLVVSAGEQQSSRTVWRDVAEAAQANGTAVFAITPEQLVPPIPSMRQPAFPALQETNAFDAVCQQSGGALLSSTSSGLPNSLATIAQMLRERYIIEFPRPSNSTAGRHSFEVRVEKTTAFVRPAGIAVPMEDPAIQNDPTTIRSDPDLAPVQGSRRPPD